MDRELGRPAAADETSAENAATRNTYYDKTAAETVRLLEADVTGLSSHEAETRLNRYGPNSFEKQK